MGPDNIEVTCPSCAFSRSVPLTKLPPGPVKVTCPQCLLLQSSTALIVTVLNLAGVTSQGGRNIWLAVIVVIVSALAVEATFRLHGEYRDAVPATYN